MKNKNFEMCPLNKDVDGKIYVKHTLQCYFIKVKYPEMKLKSEFPDIQERINLYEKSENKNLALFLSPAKREFKEEFGNNY